MAAPQAQHTPGPWRIAPARNENEAVIWLDIRDSADKHRGSVAQCYSAEHIGGITVAERDANAHLIAAAPDLLSALRTLVLYHDNDEAFLESCADYPAVHERSYAQMVDDFWRAARAAIAKAEGRANG